MGVGGEELGEIDVDLAVGGRALEIVAVYQALDTTLDDWRAGVEAVAQLRHHLIGCGKKRHT